MTIQPDQPRVAVRPSHLHHNRTDGNLPKGVDQTLGVDPTSGAGTHVARAGANPAQGEVAPRSPAPGRFAGRIGASDGTQPTNLTLTTQNGQTTINGTAGNDDIHVRNKTGGGLIVTSGDQRIELSDAQAKRLTIDTGAGSDRVRIDPRVRYGVALRGVHAQPDRRGPGAPKPVDGAQPPPAPSAAELKTYDETVARIKKHSAYKALSPAAKKKADEIMTLARKKPNPNYYAKKLELLFNTPDAPPAKTATSQTKRTDTAVKKAEARMKTPEGKADATKEEKVTADKARTWTTLNGDGATYKVDRSDPKNIVVKMKVRLSGDPAEVAKVKKLEDDIEKSAATKGYTLDLEFVTTGGSDVFDVNVDPKKWTTSANWIGSADSLAHEAHHLLNLPDRYNYIESHADNADMKMETRLHWFLVQAKKPADPNGIHSIMNSGSNKPLHDDVCQVAQMPDTKKCIDTRTKAYGGP